ncbi:unnamed protein product, partial [Mesorhabditis spiculigera]
MFLGDANDTNIVLTAAKAWAGEIERYGWPDFPEFTKETHDRGVKHAPQMIWGRTKKIGCGLASCANKTKLMFVCHYDPAGNWLNGDAYTKITKLAGKCSKCPEMAVRECHDKLTSLCPTLEADVTWCGPNS